MKRCVCVSVQWMRIGPRRTLSCVKDVLPPKMCVQCIVLVRFPVSYPVCNSPSFVLPGVSKCCVSPNCGLPLLTTPPSFTVCQVHTLPWWSRQQGPAFFEIEIYWDFEFLRLTWQKRMTSILLTIQICRLGVTSMIAIPWHVPRNSETPSNREKVRNGLYSTVSSSGTFPKPNE